MIARLGVHLLHSDGLSLSLLLLLHVLMLLSGLLMCLGLRHGRGLWTA